jgi:subtilase family serine protease
VDRSILSPWPKSRWGAEPLTVPWLAVLQGVPWTDVIRNAPKVADGAKKLWNTVSGKPAQPQTPVASSEPNASLEAQVIVRLEARVASLEATVSEFHSQMLASSELIKALAEQNGQLVARVESNRVRMLWLSLAIAAIGGIAVVGVVLALQRAA